jgi:ACS family 4-hydroxyphenylacetate permease-like MFS transporter
MLQHTLDSETKAAPAAAEGSMWRELLGARVLLLSLAYFCLVTSLNTYATWTPQIIREFLGGSQNFAYIGLLGAIPPFFTLLAMPLVSFSSDRLKERLLHTSALFGLTAIGWIAVVLFGSPQWQLAGLVLVSIGAFSGMAIFWSFATPLLSAKNRPGSIGLISSAGILGSATSPTIVGMLRDFTASFNTGIWYAVVLLAIGIVSLFVASTARRTA